METIKDEKLKAIIEANTKAAEEFIRKFNMYAADELTKATLESVIDYDSDEIKEKYKDIGLAINLIDSEYQESKSYHIIEMIRKVNELYCGTMDGNTSLQWLHYNLKCRFYYDESVYELACNLIDKAMEDDSNGE